MYKSDKLYGKVITRAAALCMALALGLSGCGNKFGGESNVSGETGGNSQSGENTGNGEASENVDTADLNLEIPDSADMFTSRDREIGYDESQCVAITLKGDSAECASKGVSISGSTVTITEEASYILSGTLTNGQIIVDAESTDKIQLILNGVEINCDTSAAIYVRQADKVFITLARDTRNVLSNQEEFVQIDDNNVDAVIFSKDDLTLNGLGELAVNAACGHGIVSKDDLVFTGGTYTITAAKNGITGKDSIRFADGSFQVIAGSDSIHGDNDDDATLGYIYIEGGNFDLTPAEDAINSSNAVYVVGGEIQIEAGDDAVHGDVGVAVVDGEINILSCYEGIEGKQVEIAGGNISIAASDDGLNATDGSSTDTGFGGFFGGGKGGFGMAQDCSIVISGGCIHIDSSADGVDSNGTLSVTGGEVYISGQDGSANSAVDFETEATISGGTLVAAGYSGMVENFSSSSTQGVMLVNLSAVQEGGTEITLKDSDGKVLASYSPEKRYNSVIVSCSELVEGGIYTLTAGTETQTIEMTSLVYGSSGFGGFGGGGKGGFGGFGNGRDQNSGGFGDRGQNPGGVGGGRGQNSGDGSAADESAALPSMETSEGMPEMPSGEWPEGMPEMPSGEWPEGMPEMPSGEWPEGMPEMPSGEWSEGMPEMPGGEIPEGMPEMPSGEVPGGMPGAGGFGQGGEFGAEMPGTEAADESTGANSDGTV